MTRQERELERYEEERDPVPTWDGNRLEKEQKHHLRQFRWWYSDIGVLEHKLPAMLLRLTSIKPLG